MCALPKTWDRSRSGFKGARQANRIIIRSIHVGGAEFAIESVQASRLQRFP